MSGIAKKRTKRLSKQAENLQEFASDNQLNCGQLSLTTVKKHKNQWPITA